MNKFWRWVKNEAGENPIRTLYLEGYIAEDSWFDDEITPKQFKTDLYGDGSTLDDVVVKIHSPGGDCFAAAQIYNMLKEYPGKVSVHVDGLAASAASVIAMAGDEVCVSPLSVIMIHNPAMLVAGEVSDLEAGINLLSEVKESIINAYQTKSGLSRAKIARMMDAETWMSAHKAIDLNFADTILYEEKSAEKEPAGFIFDKLTVTNALINKLPGVKASKSRKVTAKLGEKEEETQEIKEIENQIPVNQLQKRLELIKNWR
ncbi:head maturation protease, ClpP-related [Clostridium sp. DL1XJH146]